MDRRSKRWMAAALLFLLVNVAGAAYAAMQGEIRHAGLHIVLLLPGLYLVRRLAANRDTLGAGAGAAGELTAQPGAFDDSLRRLEQSMDAMAIEVERIGEGQRFMTRLFAEKGAQRPPADGASAPSGHDAGPS